MRAHARDGRCDLWRLSTLKPKVYGDRLALADKEPSLAPLRHGHRTQKTKEYCSDRCRKAWSRRKMKEADK